ncbi:MAG: GspE/PulE family protein [Spirochaetia bacterium]|jgi:type II secretory ATPase GspE/PulE/Tfp pilus assembly ATPase PilB-like protein|nr:GspE/PulE family protein [Spirochaetia bacterium]
MELTENSVLISDFLPLPDDKNQYSSNFTQAHSAVVLKSDDISVTIGICNSDNLELKEILSHFHDKKIIYKRIDHDELSEYLGKLHGGLDDQNLPASSSVNEKLLLDKIANDAPIINFVNSTIIEGIRKRASDIHIEAFTNTVKVRYRIDGVLQTVKQISPSMFPAVSSRIKIMSNLNIMERRLPQDGRTSVQLGEDSQDIRVSIVPTARGESIVLRLLNRKSTLIGLDVIGLRNEGLVDVREMLKTPFGLILATGPTGSGKTTTLNSMLREMDSERQKIITIEDPIEYVIDGIDQIQTNEAIGLTFSTILKRILRQDPNIIMVGEIRDSETANLCIRAALTGHLVLSTLHTNDSVSVIDRLHDMGVEPFMIAAVLKTAMAQRLVRRLCPSCRVKRKISPIEKEFFRETESIPGLVANKFAARPCIPEYIFEPGGCDNCDGTGYHGRTLIHEYFSWDEEIERLIVAGAKHSEIKAYLKKTGMVTLFEDGLEKIKEGLTTLAELDLVMTV